jgi:glutaredoxin
MIVYSQTTCAPCKSVKQYLDHKGVKYIERNITTHPDHTKTLVKHTGGRVLVPTVVKGDEVVVGLNWAAIAKLIQ